MKLLKTISLSSLSLFLLSCQSVPEKNRKLLVEQCSPNIRYETVEVLRDGVPTASTIIDEKRSECFCRRYKYSLDFIGPIAESTVSKELFYCHKLVGNPPDEYGKVTNFLGDLRKDLQTAAK